MNRTSLCIKMLLLLKSRGRMNTAQLSQELETNPRNIREFRKELEVAGYNIKETKGRYGGYELVEDDLFPVIRLSDDEVKALDESRYLVSSHKEYTRLKSYNNAIDKIMQMYHNESRSPNYFMDTPGYVLTNEMIAFLDTMKKGIELGRCISLTYQTSKEDSPCTFLFDPYEILHYHQAYYVIGFSHRRDDIRIFRFSDQRMFNCELTNRKFLKDSNYRLEMYIGKHSIIKGNFVQVTLKVKANIRRMFKEMYWGYEFKEEIYDDYSLFSFIIEDVLDLYRKIYSFTDGIEIVSPKEIRENYVQSLKNTLKNYESR
ncbi:helix-turn-helix transcriptional regulator [Floccifex sp.]|uniref:helix-turn-helix transcriptional regulator n=1 Tax=Floccifex sp. TaxID=2815810 RepID=UPI0029FF301B|nr:WYL domain-containing protein [Floccifex sp.]MDD7281443.1 WYL domain-containing transcriptional regulator [Erysipelotrichaceae bacterium]MDY2958587.1 WYL domain-containing transcriptional regulator [Floccifex sp.]